MRGKRKPFTLYSHSRPVFNKWLDPLLIFSSFLQLLRMSWLSFVSDMKTRQPFKTLLNNPSFLSLCHLFSPLFHWVVGTEQNPFQLLSRLKPRTEHILHSLFFTFSPYILLLLSVILSLSLRSTSNFYHLSLFNFPSLNLIPPSDIFLPSLNPSLITDLRSKFMAKPPSVLFDSHRLRKE